MKNQYLKNLSKIEFVVTDACTGKCKHCSQGEHDFCSSKIDPDLAVDAVQKIASQYKIETVMAFGGEPLLHREAVYKILSCATSLGIPKRQLITNGYFTKDTDKIQKVAHELFSCGVNDLLLSVDAFHEETIPFDTVKYFARVVKALGIPIRIQPAWLVSPHDDNPYNLKTRELLHEFSRMDISIGDGNVIFPEGHALKYLADYFYEIQPDNPYVEDPYDVRCISFSASGDVLSGNIYREDIMDIIKNYKPDFVY